MTAAARFVLRSDPSDLFALDLESGGPFLEERASATLMSRGGRIDGVAQWTLLEIDEHDSYENSPAAEGGTTGAVFHRFAHAEDTKPGALLTVGGSHDDEGLRIWCARG
jgi:hypothetical protein